MQKGIFFIEISKKKVGFALLKRDLPPPHVKNWFIIIFWKGWGQGGGTREKSVY